jgi:hypothetical protein
MHTTETNIYGPHLGGCKEAEAKWPGLRFTHCCQGCHSAVQAQAGAEFVEVIVENEGYYTVCCTIANTIGKIMGGLRDLKDK